MTLPLKLIQLLRLAHSAERAAAYAYQGHAASVSSDSEREALKQIEDDEWHHRALVLGLMTQYGIKPSLWLEVKFAFIGRFISWSCALIGWFLPMYFAGRLESQNVTEYYKMMELFHSVGITEHDSQLAQMGAKELEHELFFLTCLGGHSLLPLFSWIFRWGPERTPNKEQLTKLTRPVESAQTGERPSEPALQKASSGETAAERPFSRSPD
jgi:hypothetical protein